MAVDIFLVANLLYFRTYYTVIPLDSYLLVGNMTDFVSSIFASFRWCDLLFPATTAAMILALKKLRFDRQTLRRAGIYAAATILCGCTIWGLMLAQGGFRKSYGKMLIHRQLSATPTYSIFGTLIYEALDNTPEMTPELTAKIDEFVFRARNHTPAPAFAVPHTVVVLILESFESWVLERSVEGIEITPNLNRLLAASDTFYAPNVLTQVKGGRSIDAQLLLTAGLLPISDGCFSSRYPYSTYPTVVKAFRERNADLRAYSFTPDKATMWNQMIVAGQFGFDRLFDRSDFGRSEQTGHGNHKRAADGPFLAECLEKFDALAADNDAPLYLQCITYSGHTPFVLPEKLKRVSFPDDIPRLMDDYMTTANYTDAAVGAFVDGLRAHPRFADAVIVITGDHEGLASDRAMLAADKAGAGIVSPECFTPFIILGAPVGIRYEKVMGQIDMYPTLLDMFGLGEYGWRGLGRSVLRDDAPKCAVDASGRVLGDDRDAERLREAWRMSDVMIRGDYFGRRDADAE
ncbi:MAG: sulfatase-like hydrolase/transferase [Alistipes sp.]|nr:sulfatase-like hydrolase/transferase [Alistipes sp.]